VVPARIACVYRRDLDHLHLAGMEHLRVVRMAEALARRGHDVDLVLKCPEPRRRAPRLRDVPFAAVRWDDYDVVKTFFHLGFESLRDTGGAHHPFIVSKLGSVVGARDGTDGVYFFNHVRDRLFRIQDEIARTSRAVTVLTERSAALWRREHGPATQLTLVPTGVDADIPAPNGNPAARLGIGDPYVLFAGNIYGASTQPEVNREWQARLSRIGRMLRDRGMQLVVMGRGDTDRLDRDAVHHLGLVDASEVWDWQRHARAGLVLAHGPVQDNESSKIYYYLRTGLPVVSDRSVPNAALIEHTGVGTLVDYGDDAAIAAACAAAAPHPDTAAVVADVVRRHSWDARAALYDDLFAEAAAARRNDVGGASGALTRQAAARSSVGIDE
jgi:glycosyltransferase involved in cell wall biosynthesis